MGTAYGVELNDGVELARRQAEFLQAPYNGQPKAPILYIKPANTIAIDGAAVPLPVSVVSVAVAATLALRFGSSPTTPVAAALAIDISEPHASLYRPAIRQQCRDRFLPLGRWVDWTPALSDLALTTFINDHDVHRWSLARLVRPPLPLVEEISSFMTFGPGDMLLIGLPSEPPQATVGQSVRVEAAGFSPLSITLVREEEA